MKLVQVRRQRAGDHLRIIGLLDSSDAHPYFAFPQGLEAAVSESADAFVPALLVPSLEKGEPLEIVPPISRSLATRIPRIVDVLLALFPNFHRVDVCVRSGEESGIQSGNWVATLFSGGVDSFYTLLKGLSSHTATEFRPTHLLFMRGLEQRLDESGAADATLAVIEEVAQAFGVRVICGQTNLRMLFGLNYELYYHAAALIASGLVLSNGIRRLLVPSTYSYGQLIPWGSHPLLDELWSTESMEVIHHGAEARRVEKVADIVAHHPQVLQYLRVCLKNQAGPANCGRCGKCARTMIALEIIGALAHARTFPAVSRRILERTLRADSQIFVQELCDLARRTGNDESIELLNRVVRKQQRRHAIKTLVETTPVLAGLMPHFHRLRRRLRDARLPAIS